MQRLEGDTAQGEWAGTVHQYVLGLDVVGKKDKVVFFFFESIYVRIGVQNPM